MTLDLAELCDTKLLDSVFGQNLPSLKGPSHLSPGHFLIIVRTQKLHDARTPLIGLTSFPALHILRTYRGKDLRHGSDAGSFDNCRSDMRRHVPLHLPFGSSINFGLNLLLRS